MTEPLIWAYEQREPILFDDAEAYEDAMRHAHNSRRLPWSVTYVLQQLTAIPLEADDHGWKDRIE